MVTMVAFEKMVDAAVESGSKYGINRKDITWFLCAELKGWSLPSKENWTYFEKEIDSKLILVDQILVHYASL